MAALDFSLAENFPQNVTMVAAAVKTAATVPNIGEIALLDASHAGYLVTGASFTSDKVDSDDNVVGLWAEIDVAPTASADGQGFVWVPVNGTRLWLNGKALAKASLATAQEWTKVAIDVTSGGIETIDQSTTTKGIACILPFFANDVDSAIPVAGDTNTGAMTIALTCAGL